MCICINVFSVPFVCAQTAPGEACGYLWYRNPEGNQCVPWVPQEGDIVLMSHRGERQSWVYHIGRSGHPFHAALIIRQATGNLTMLEAGGSEDMRVTQLPIGYRMGKYFQYHDSPVAWVRRIKRPVTPEQSVRMARFGNTQLGKPFASAWRMWPMVLPTRPMPSTRPDQSSWYCSELVLETLFTAGLVDDRVRPAETTPSDLYHNKRVDLSDLWCDPVEWTAVAQLPTERPVRDARTH